MDRHSVSWRGYIPAVTTPFTAFGELDESAVQALYSWLYEQGMHGIVVLGTQGEWFSMTGEEKRRLLAIAGEQLGGKLTLIAGCTAFRAEEAIKNIAWAADCGFDGALLTPPPYMVPNEDEILAFYQEVNDASRLPICVYNWPPGTNVDMSLPLLSRLAELERVVAIKNSTPDLRHFMDVFFTLKDRVRVFGIPMNELGAALVLQHGADGTMGAGGVLGREHPDFFNALWEGDLERARALGERDTTLMRAWFTPGYTGRFGAAQAIFKEALNQQGLPGGYTRTPLLPLSEAGVGKVRETLTELGMIH